MKYVFIFFIKLYRYLISPLLTQSCRFTPSCSVYAIEALNTHGYKKGVRLIVRRLLKCHPFTKETQGIYDPVIKE